VPETPSIPPEPPFSAPNPASEAPKEPAPVLDVHPPPHAASTWRDFFIHIATIVIGLLIAVGLEQTVESLHHRHQLRELREGVISDARIYLHDADQLRLLNSQLIEDLSSRIEQVREAMSRRQPLGPPAYRPEISTNTIRLGNFSAAKSSGLVQLLSQNEINTLGDAEVAVVKSEVLKEHAQEAMRKRFAFEQRFQRSYPAGPFDFSAASPAQLNEYLGLLLEERVRRDEFLGFLHLMHGGAEAFIQGERDLYKLRQAEEASAAHSPH
jgi:hypothetical protein